MVITTNRRNLQITDLHLFMNGEMIEPVTEFKYLGCIIDVDLNFSKHVDFVCGKVNARLGALSRVRDCLTTNLSMTLYKTLVLPILEYCSFLFVATSAENANRLQVMQNRACRQILQKGRLESTEGLHRELKLSRLSTRYHYHAVCLMYKCINGLVPEYLSDLFTKVGAYVSYQRKYLRTALY